MRGLQGARPRRIFLSIAPVLLFLALGAHAVGLPDSLDAGIELFRTGRYSEAMEAFGEMLHGDGSGRRGAAVLYWLGECSLALGDHEEARRYFRAAADVPDPVPFYASRSLLRLGAVLERLDRGGEAADAYGRILARYAGEQPAAEAVFRLGGISYRDGLYGSAASFYSKLLIDYPASPLAEDSRFFLAESERALGSLDEAKRRYGIVLSSGGSRWRSAASFRLAEISVMQGELEEAAVLVDGLVSRVPEDEWTGRAYKLKGEILLARESYWEAVLSFEEAIPLLGEKERQDSCYLRGIALEQCRCPGEAVDSFRQSGNGEKPRAELAILLAQMGRGEEAAREFETLLSLYPQSLRREEFLGYLAGVYWEAGDASRSLKALDALVKDFSASPRFVEYLYRRATVSMTIGLFPDALSDLQRILKDFPLSGYGPESLYCVGFVYSRRGEYIRALRFFNNAADSAPTPALALRARRAIASCMFDMGNLGEALTAFRSLLPQAKDEATRGSLIFDIARTLYKLGRLDEAADGFLEASRTVFSPSEAEDALYWRAWCLSRLERPVEARDAFLSVEESYPHGARAADSLLRAAGCAVRLSEDETAIGILDRAILRAEAADCGEVREEALYEKGLALSRLGRGDESEAAFEELADEFPDSVLAAEAFFARAAKAMNGESYDEAALLYSEVNRRFPASPLAERALYWEGESALASGDHAEAARVFYRFLDEYPRGSFLSSALDGLQRALISRGDVESAREYFTRADEDPSLSPTSRYLIGLAFAKLLLPRNPWEALPFLEELKLSVPEDQAGEAYLALGMCRASVGDGAGARAVLGELLQSRSDRIAAGAGMEIARSWEADGELRKALSAFSSVYRLFHGFPDIASEALFNAARLAYVLGERGMAASLHSLLKREYGDSIWVKRLDVEKNSR